MGHVCRARRVAAVAWPTAFAIAALYLLVLRPSEGEHRSPRLLALRGFDHLGLHLARRDRAPAIQRLETVHRSAFQDRVTGLPNRDALVVDLGRTRAISAEPYTLSSSTSMACRPFMTITARPPATASWPDSPCASSEPGRRRRRRIDRCDAPFRRPRTDRTRMSGEFLLSRPASPDPMLAFAPRARLRRSPRSRGGRGCGSRDAACRAAPDGLQTEPAALGPPPGARRADGGAGGTAPGPARTPAHGRFPGDLGLSPARPRRRAIDDISLAAELHDIGLLTVPDSVLEKETCSNPRRSN